MCSPSLQCPFWDGGSQNCTQYSNRGHIIDLHSGIEIFQFPSSNRFLILFGAMKTEVLLNCCFTHLDTHMNILGGDCLILNQTVALSWSVSAQIGRHSGLDLVSIFQGFSIILLLTLRFTQALCSTLEMQSTWERLKKGDRKNCCLFSFSSSLPLSTVK